MPSQPIPPQQTTAIAKALANLTDGDWNWTTFDLTDNYDDDPSKKHETDLKNAQKADLRDKLETEWERYVRGAEVEKYGRELTELEETYERSRWLRTQAMIPNLDQFNQLCDACETLVDELTTSGWQSRLGNRAGLQQATSDERPSLLVEFRPEFPPEPPPLDDSEYQKLLGGPHVFGARLLWWCAAAKSPNKFGYPAVFSQQIWAQPFWFRQTGPGVCCVNPRPLALINEAAEYVARNEENQESPERVAGKQEKQEADSPIATSKTGPGPGCVFNWKGEKKIELQPVQFHLIEFLWNEWEKGNNPIDAEKVFDAVWPGDRDKEPAYASCISRLNKRLAGIPVVVYFRNGHFRLEVGDHVD